MAGQLLYSYSLAERIKLSGVEAGAEPNPAITDKEITYGNGTGITSESLFQWDTAEEALTIGDYSSTTPFSDTSDIDNGIDIRGVNPAIVLRDTGASAPVSIQPGSSAKLRFREENANPASVIEMMNILNDYAIEFPNSPNVDIGDGTGTVELNLLAGNGAGIFGCLGFWETTFENNGVRVEYNTNDNCLDFQDWTGGSKSANPILRVDRSTNGIDVDNRIALLSEISEPSSPSSGAIMYLDSSDSDFKIKFANGTVKTIATN